jgi:protein involved in polysaccharide export with SLBB domain
VLSLFRSFVSGLKFRPDPAVWLLALALLSWTCGCAAKSADPPHQAAAVQAAGPDAVQRSALSGGSDRQRLEDVWKKRMSDGFGPDFTLGPGDILDISVPLEQLKHREVRVSPRYTIELPLAGVMSVRGMSEQDLTEALRQRLSKYMYDPPVSLFVKHYGSREVAVGGAVEKPGLYTLTSRSDTLMDMISRAGGMTKYAAAKVIFVPGGPGGREVEHASLLRAAQAFEAGAQASGTSSSNSGVGAAEAPNGAVHTSARVRTDKVASVAPIADDEGRPRRSEALMAGPTMTGLHPLTISLSNPGMQKYLGMPARPRDVLIIPSAGEVAVGGWVRIPGAYKITPGMSALSAISAAGGAMFSSSAEILRTAPDGQRLSIPVDISKVQGGEEPDVPMQSGDVVMVDRSAAGALPYAFYELFNKFGTGMYVPIP